MTLSTLFFSSNSDKLLQPEQTAGAGACNADRGGDRGGILAAVR